MPSQPKMTLSENRTVALAHIRASLAQWTVDDTPDVLDALPHGVLVI